MLDSSIIVALISGLCVAIPSVVATVYTQNAHEQVQNEKMNVMNQKIDELSTRVQMLAEFDKRISLLEQSMHTLYEKGGMKYEG